MFQYFIITRFNLRRERHGRWSKEKEVKNLRNRHLWMLIIHCENKANDFLGFGNVSWQGVNKFHIDKDLFMELESRRLALSLW